MDKNLQPNISDPIVIYNTVKNKRKEYLKTHFGIRSKKQPWYMLTKGKCKNYEERMKSWGACVDYFDVPSETKVMSERVVIKCIGSANFMERLAQHKLAKWVRKNPAPCDEMDLFKNEFLEPWKEERDKALEHFRDIVVSIYDKTVLPYDRKKALIVPMIDMGGGVYSYPNMDPITIGYPLCKFAGKRFVKKDTVVDVCKEALKKVSKSGYNCKSVDYTYERKVLLSVAA